MKIAKLKTENCPMILHVDGDSFFASCEASLDPSLRNKPLVTGGERGIASAMSKEAKALGISRGMPVFQIRKLFPQVIIRSSDYLNYSIFAERMYAIVRRYSDAIEEYSIDECFAVLENEELVPEIKETLQKELGMTFSLGLAKTKVLAKLASSVNKPDGLTILKQPEGFLKKVDIGKVWGIGPATAKELRTKGIQTAYDLSERSAGWGRAHLNKPTLDIWQELRGIPTSGIHVEDDAHKSIQSTETFHPPTSDKKVLLSELSKNIENASVKMRREGLLTQKIYYFLKTQEFRYFRHEIKLDSPVGIPSEIVKRVKETFSQIYVPQTLYRATGVTLADLIPQDKAQNDLFGEVSKASPWKSLYKTIEEIDRRYGSHTLVLGSSLGAFKRQGGAIHRRLRIPYMGEAS